MTRPLDLALALVLLVVTAPLLGLAALAIKLESRGPVFYRQRRVGKDGRPFELWIHGLDTPAPAIRSTRPRATRSKPNGAPGSTM